MSNKKDFIIPFFGGEGLEKKVCPHSLTLTVTDPEEKHLAALEGMFGLQFQVTVPCGGNSR